MGRHDRERILQRSFGRKFKSRLGSAQSDNRAFDLREVTFELIGVGRSCLSGKTIASSARRRFRSARLVLFHCVVRLSGRHEAEVLCRHGAHQPIVCAESLNETGA
jgi:hypothetical protein